MRRLPLPAPRGVLFDRNGKVLVENQSTFNIALVREQTKNIDETLHILAIATGVDEAGCARPSTGGGGSRATGRSSSSRTRRCEQVVAFRAAAMELPGIIHQEVPARQYPAGDMAAHLFGYVGEVTEPQLTRAEYQGVEPGADRRPGRRRAGLQQAADGRGRRSGSSSSTASAARFDESGDAGRRSRPAAAADDRRRRPEGDRGRFPRRRLQRRGGRARSPDRRSALARSLPAYDPNAFAAGIDRATWTALNTDELKPLQNRALQGAYSPGSTFKMSVGHRRRSRRASSRRTSACTAPAARRSTAATSSAS